MTGYSTTLKYISTVDGSINITESGGKLSTAPSAELIANNGGLNLVNNSSATSAGILIGAGSQLITAGAGGQNINIYMGAAAGTAAGTPPAHVNYTVNGTSEIPPLPANTFLFSNGTTGTTITVSNPTYIDMNVLGGAEVTFNTGSLPKTAITVNGGSKSAPTIIQADPPAALAGLQAVIKSPGNADLPSVLPNSSGLAQPAAQLSRQTSAPDSSQLSSGPARSGQTLELPAALNTGELNLASTSAQLCRLSLPDPASRGSWSQLDFGNRAHRQTDSCGQVCDTPTWYHQRCGNLLRSRQRRSRQVHDLEKALCYLRRLIPTSRLLWQCQGGCRFACSHNRMYKRSLRV